MKQSSKQWKIYFHPLFQQQYEELKEKVIRLKANHPVDDIKFHPDVKLFQSLINLIENTIPENPLAQYFVLKDNLKKYSRVKKKGLPERYRLFFRIFPQERAIVILWLGYPRKEGDKKDCYTVFAKMVTKNKFPETFTDIIQEIKESYTD